MKIYKAVEMCLLQNIKNFKTNIANQRATIILSLF